MIADKTALPDSFKLMQSLDFYLYFVAELIQVILEGKRENATLILDEFGSPDHLQSELRRVMQARNIPRRFKHVLARRSQSEPLIQIADLIAGAILRRDAKSDSEAYDMIEGKVNKVPEYRG